MIDQPQQSKPNDHRYYPEDETELMSYLLVIWKWKHVIITGTLVFGFAAVIISVMQPTMYRTNIILEVQPLKIESGRDDKGEIVYSDTRRVIKSLIENDIKHKLLKDIKNSGRTNLSTLLEFKVAIPKDSNQIDVSFMSTAADEGVTKLNYMKKALQIEFSNRTKMIREEYEERIESKKREIEYNKVNEERIKFQIENNIVSKKEQMEDLEFRENMIIKKIDNLGIRLNEIKSNNKTIANDIELINRQKDSFLKNNNQNKIFAALMYNNTMQQYIYLKNLYFYETNSLLNKIEEEKYNRYKIQIEIKTVSNEIKELEKENVKKNDIYVFQPELYKIEKQIKILSKQIEKLEEEKFNVQNIRVIQQPFTTELPKINRIKRNAVLALITSFFLMTFISFFVEYIRKYKNQKQQ